jgi:hypothetical protein
VVYRRRSGRDKGQERARFYDERKEVKEFQAEI